MVVEALRPRPGEPTEGVVKAGFRVIECLARDDPAQAALLGEVGACAGMSLGLQNAR